jgi:hypothetical protein
VRNFDAEALGGLDDGFVAVADRVSAVEFELDWHCLVFLFAHRGHDARSVRGLNAITLSRAQNV